MTTTGQFWVGYAPLLVPVVLALTGCASTPPSVTEVKVPVRVECVKEVPARPTYETEALQKEATDGQKILALVRDWARSRKYEGSLEAVVEGCK